MKREVLLSIVACLIDAALSGCDRGPNASGSASTNAGPQSIKPASAQEPAQPSAPSAAKPDSASAGAPDRHAPRDPIVPESKKWSREQCLEKLSDEKLGVSAAVRLTRLAESDAAKLPDPLPSETAQRLALAKLKDGLWAIGLREATDPSALAAPLFITGEGKVSSPEPAGDWTLHVSKDAEVFPHLLIAARRVQFADESGNAAIVLQSPDKVSFALRRQDGYPYVALLLRPDGGEPIEVTRYKWDPYDLAFSGPAMDKLPDPPGGKFEIDLKLSKALNPVGGEIPEPKELPPQQRPKPERDLPPPY